MTGDMRAAEARFRGIFAVHRQAILAYALRRVDEPVDAADVVADVFLVAWRRLDEVPGGAGTRPWLFGVSKNVIRNYRRGQVRRHALAESLRAELAAIGEFVETSAEAAACGADLDSHALDAAQVRAAMAQLRDADRELLELLVWQEYSREDAAVILGMSRAAIRLRYHRALKRLEKILEKPPPQPISPQGAAGVKRSTRPGHDLGKRQTTYELEVTP